MEKNVSSVAEQDKTAEVKKNPKLIELARPYKFDDKEYTEIDLSGLDDLTIKDAVLIIKKLYNEGEMAVMITPETATAYTDALAAAATKLPIEFFQLLPIGASKKVRQTVQASLRSAAAEEDGDEDEHSHIMKFGKPYTYKGEKYTEVDLSGVANLTGMNVRQAENRMEEEDIRAAEKTLNYYYCCLIASMATGKDVAFFLGLPLADVGALIFRHKGKYLQHDVAEKGAHQIFAPAGIQQRHIQHYDVDAFLFRQYPPLLQNLPIVPAQTVDALDVEQIVFFQFPHQPLVLRTVEVLAGLLVHKDVFLRDLQFSQCNQLSVLVLVTGADPDIAI